MPDNNLIKLNHIFSEALDHDVRLTLEMTTDQIEGWNSLDQIRIMSEIENSFDITFNISEVLGFKDIGALLNLISNKIKH